MNPETREMIVEKLRNKKTLLLAIGGGVIVLLIIIFISLFISSNKQTTANVSQEETVTATTSPVKETIPTKESIAPTITSAPLENYHGLFFNVSYPQDWEQAENWPDGTYLVLKPSNSNASAVIAFEVNDSNRVSVASMSAGLTILGLKREFVSVPVKSAQRFSGIIDFPEKLIRNTAYLFEHNGKIYFIKLSYQQPEIDPTIEEAFAHIVSTVTLR